MKKFPLLILLLTFFIALPSYANQANEKNNFMKMRKRFEKIDKNSDGLLSKEEMMEAVHVGAAIKSGATLVHGVQMMKQVIKLEM